MDRFSFIDSYRTKFPHTEIRENEPMSTHTTFKIGGSVRYMVYPRKAGELAELLRLCREANVPYIILGRGSNLLVSESPHAIIAVETSELSDVTFDGDLVTAGAGVTLSRLASLARDRGLAGLEFAHGIPGTLGGAVVMNAGAYGGEMKDVITRVSALDEELQPREYDISECGFGYRQSAFDNKTVLAATMKLRCDDTDAIRERMDELSLRRREKQPLQYPSAGSTFKRPKNGYAAKLIDDAGMKGFRIGGAMVSEKHAGFIINTGGASFENVVDLINAVRHRVLETSGVELETEVKIIW